MIRPLAASLSCVAMAVTAVSGAMGGRPADEALSRCVVAMLAFAAIGAATGWILDDLIRDGVKRRYRTRFETYRDAIDRLRPADPTP